MKKTILLLSIGLWAIITNSCVMPHTFAVIAPGKWRARLMLDGKRSERLKTRKEDMVKRDEKVVYEEVVQGELPFTFEVVYEAGGDSFYIELINGDERTRVDDIRWGHNLATGADTMRVYFHPYDTYLVAQYEVGVIEGEWVVPYRGAEYRIPFVAKHGQDYRFTQLRKTPVADLSGKWATTFGLMEGETPYRGIGEFAQQGNRLTGTFRTETGDYRYMEGTVQGNKAYLSVFDGAHAFLMEAKIGDNGNTLSGYFRSGTHYTTLWEATRSDTASLADPYLMTTAKAGNDRMAFRFPDVDSNMVSLTDSRYQGKVKLIQLMGTWCPNCMDETRFLKSYLDKVQPDKVAVVALAYERREGFAQAAAVVRNWKERMGVTYEVLLAGGYDKKAASATLPMLTEVKAFPTLVVVDKNDRIRLVHTGFDGPATAEYQVFVKAFEAKMAAILAEE